MTYDAKSVLVVSPNEAFSECLREMFDKMPDHQYSTKLSTMKGLNGHASQIAAEHDVVIFEADPDDPEDVDAIAGACSGRGGKTIYFALTGNDVTVSKARRLREIGIDEVLPVSLTGPELSAAIDETVRRNSKPTAQLTSGGAHDGCIIPVVQARGGIGATTVAVNLAYTLLGKASMFRKTEKKKVALLDFDLQFGNANVFLDIEDNAGFLKMIEQQPDPDITYLKGIMQTHSSGIDLLSSPTTIAPLTSLTSDLVGKTLDVLRREYDYVIVDLPRALVDWIEPVLNRATRVVLVTDTSVPCVRQAKRIKDFFLEDHLGLEVEVVINREKRGLFRSEQTREAEKLLNTRLRHWLPDDPKLARNAADLGRPAVQMKPKADLGKAITRLAADLEILPQSQATKSV